MPADLPTTRRDSIIGRRIGPIRITGWLDEGGMGEVFVGRDERLDRQVALKAVRRSRHGDEARARLLREARILSRLDDPKICQIYDYVETDDGDWLVLELVDGVTLATAELWRAPLARRLEVAQQIAEVLVEAHGLGIVHRDLKPSNVMLTRNGQVKVLDFGIARWSEHDAEPVAAEASGPWPEAPWPEASRPELETQFGDLLGTVQYMSPEQARSEAVTPASDLYAFGLLLREILTGEPPYPDDMAPTRVLLEVAAGRRPEPSASRRSPSREVVALIDALTRAEPDRRPTAGETVRRLSWERGRPKRRLQRALAVSAVVVALVAGGLYVLDLRATLDRSLAARHAAEQARTEARELSGFMTGLFDLPDGETSATTLTARQILDRGADRIDRDFADQPRLRARLAFTLGQVYESLGVYERSHGLLEESLELRRSSPSLDPLAIADSLFALGWSERYAGNLATAEANFLEALAIREAELGPVHRDVAATLNGLAVVERRQDRFAEAEAHYLRSIEIVETLDGPDHPVVASRVNNLALLYYYWGRLDRAEAMYRRALEIKEATLEPNHPSMADGYNNLANVLMDRGRLAEAEALYRRSLAISQDVLGADHPKSASSASNLGFLFEESGNWPLAEKFLTQAYETRLAAFGDQHPEVANSLSSLGGLDILARRFDVGEARLAEALAVQTEHLGERHLDVAMTRSRLAASGLGQGRLDEARQHLAVVLSIYREALGAEHPSTGFASYLAALGDIAEGDLESAAERLDSTLESYRAAGYSGIKVELAVLAREVASRPPESRTDRLGWVAAMAAPGDPKASPAWRQSE